MPFKIIRNDITKMECDAIVNTANPAVEIGPGCDRAVYEAAGKEELLAYRRQFIGEVAEGQAFVTPAFNLSNRYIIHAVSPLFVDGEQGEEELLRACYDNALNLAVEYEVKSIAFPLISTGNFLFPKEEGLRIAVDQISRFLIHQDMEIYLLVFDEESTKLSQKIAFNLESYIDQNYVEQAQTKEYSGRDESGALQRLRFEDEVLIPEEPSFPEQPSIPKASSIPETSSIPGASLVRTMHSECILSAPVCDDEEFSSKFLDEKCEESDECESQFIVGKGDEYGLQFIGDHEKRLAERVAHMSDSFSEYLLYLIESRGLTNADVYKAGIVDKKTFSKIKNNKAYHPGKLTAMCLCVGAKLNLDETKDLLARAGYALSPCDMTDVIFSYFIENEIYDICELDIQLEEHGLECIIK